MSQIGSARTATSLAVLVLRAAELSSPLPCAQSSWLWFSDVPADLELAKAACRRCPLRRPCLAGALERGEACGVWGGEIFESGAIIAQKRPRGRPAGDQPRKTGTSESREGRAAAI
jgi:WhiB family transcriptional regulator, redox-sensing transcriptional regulator